jgi:hypothetical protein
VSRYAEYRETPPLGGPRPPKPVTLPPVALDDLDVEAEAREAQDRVIERRTIRRGLDAWEAINKSQSFGGWLAIGKALLIGREAALRSTGANAPMGRRYCLVFSQWINAHGFTGMQKSVRSVAVELAENAKAITTWRDSLPERQRRRLVHPLSVTRRWRASLNHGNGKCPQDFKRDAVAAWRRFVSCVEMLPATESAQVWRAVSVEAAAALAPA